jgi:hypothetical protein
MRARANALDASSCPTKDDRVNEPIPAAAPRANSGDGISDADPQLTFLQQLVEEHATIAGDVIELETHTWAIHGTIPIDGDVIMAEYDTEQHARTILGSLAGSDRSCEQR